MNIILKYKKILYLPHRLYRGSFQSLFILNVGPYGILLEINRFCTFFFTVFLNLCPRDFFLFYLWKLLLKGIKWSNKSMKWLNKKHLLSPDLFHGINFLSALLNIQIWFFYLNFKEYVKKAVKNNIEHSIKIWFNKLSIIS